MPNVVILKIWHVKGLCGRCFFCLRPPPLLWPHNPPPYTLYTCIQYNYSQRGGVRRGGEVTRDKIRGAIVHKAGRKYQHDWLYLQSINSIKNQWRRHLGFDALSSYVVHAAISPSARVGRGRQWCHWNRHEKAHPQTPHTPWSEIPEAAKTTSNQNNDNGRCSLTRVGRCLMVERQLGGRCSLIRLTTLYRKF